MGTKSCFNCLRRSTCWVWQEINPILRKADKFKMIRIYQALVAICAEFLEIEEEEDQ